MQDVQLLENCHGYICSAMKALGYQIEAGGVCNGIALMIIQAYLINDLTAFNKRLINIHDKWKRVKAIKKSVGKTNLANNRDYQKLIVELQSVDILAFFDGITLYQDPDDYPDIFGKASFAIQTLRCRTTHSKYNHGSLRWIISI